jgi:hypothetical protein
MEDLIAFAFKDLLLNFELFSATVPTNTQEQSKKCEDLDRIVFEYKELVFFIEKAITLNED